MVQFEEVFTQNAVIGIVEIHAASALRAIRRGYQLLDKFNESLDPELATTLPGNQNSRRQEAEKQFQRLEKILEKVVPQKRQRELGVGIIET